MGALLFWVDVLPNDFRADSHLKRVTYISLPFVTRLYIQVTAFPSLMDGTCMIIERGLVSQM